MILLLETPVYKLSAEDYGDTYFLHFDYKLPIFNKAIYLNLVEQWALVLNQLKESGVKYVGSCIPKEEHKIQKFQAMFGLELYSETDEAYLYGMEI